MKFQIPWYKNFKVDIFRIFHLSPNCQVFPLLLIVSYPYYIYLPQLRYVSGGLGFLWCCLFVFYARNSPGEMPGITQIEKDYIEKSLGVYGQTEEDRQRSRVGHYDYTPMQYAAIFTQL